MINLDTQERVRITAYFQGEVKHSKSPLSLGRVNLKLPESKTKITLLLPDEAVHGGFQPLKFSVRKEGELRDQQLEGLRLTVDKIENFVMSVYIFEPGPKVGPRILHPDGTISQRETVTRSEGDVPVTRPTHIVPGAHYRLEISSKDGACRNEARLVKIEESIQESKAFGVDSQLFQAVYQPITNLIRLKVIESQSYSVNHSLFLRNITFKSGFREDLANQSILTAINKLHSERRNELEEMCKTAHRTNDIPLAQKALGDFLIALDRTDIGQLLEDQLKASVSEEHYPLLLGAAYNVVVGFIDKLKSNAKKYTQ